MISGGDPRRERETVNGEPRADFDVFLSHNGRDRSIVERIAEHLRRHGLRPFLDIWDLTPGGRWQRELADGLARSRACALCVGPHHYGEWQLEELELALIRANQRREFRVFPVLLPGVEDPFDPERLPPFLSARVWVDLRTGLDTSRGLQTLLNAVRGVAPGPATPPEPVGGVAPYRGLDVFEAEHAEFFFGREREVQRLLEGLKASRFLCVLGPSGSGKSSLVRAGLVPRLLAGALPGVARWTVCLLRPGARPLEAVAAQLAPLAGGSSMQATLDDLGTDPRSVHLAVELALGSDAPDRRLLLVVDQLEEAFTLCDDERERAQFFANLLHAASTRRGRAVVVLVMRTDFFARCAEYPDLAQRMATSQALVGPMDADALREAIEAPARRAGLFFESGLVRTILDDVGSDPGALPLLEHALLEVWHQRLGDQLTLDGYVEAGRVEGALAKRAEETFVSFTKSHQHVARRVLERLIQPGEGTEDTRRRATLRELSSSADEADVEHVVGELVAARLLTTGVDAHEQYVEVSHEALIRGWPRLRRWVDDDRESLRLHRHLTDAANDWQQLDRDDAVLFRGSRLSTTLEWREHAEPSLNERERSFLRASVRAQRRTALARAGAAVAVVVALLGVGWIAKPEIEHYVLREQAINRSPAVSFVGGTARLGGGRAAELVGLAAFSIDLHEVTNGQYRLCVRAGECTPPDQPSTEPSYEEAGESFPVVYVDARQAAAFCRWLGRRLPSAAEWERAARGTRGRRWPWGDRPPTSAHANVRLKDRQPRGVVAVDDSRFEQGASPEGVSHLVGNAREWTATPARCPPSPYRCARLWDGTSDVNSLIRRGNGWVDAWNPITGEDALESDPALREGDDAGFRCAKS